MPRPDRESRHSDAALSVYLVVQRPQLKGRCAGEPYAVAFPDEHDRLQWYPAGEEEASEHGKRFGWDRVAAIWRHPSQRLS